MLLRVADGYMELLRAEGRRAVAVQTREEAREVARITANFAAFGQGRRPTPTAPPRNWNSATPTFSKPRATC